MRVVRALATRALTLWALLGLSAYANEPESIKRYVQQAYEQAYQAYGISISQITIQAPESMQTISCEPPNSCTLSPAALSRSSGTLIAKVRSGASTLSVPITYTIDAQITILRARAVISTNANIDAQNTQRSREPLSAIKSAKPLAPSMLGSVSARSLISPNAIITQDKIKERVLVQKGDIITGILQEQNLSIQTQVQALQHGVKDEVIKVRNLSTQKILRAKVLDEKTAQII